MENILDRWRTSRNPVLSRDGRERGKRKWQKAGKETRETPIIKKHGEFRVYLRSFWAAITTFSRISKGWERARAQIVCILRKLLTTLSTYSSHAGRTRRRRYLKSEIGSRAPNVIVRSMISEESVPLCRGHRTVEESEHGSPVKRPQSPKCEPFGCKKIVYSENSQHIPG